MRGRSSAHTVRSGLLYLIATIVALLFIIPFFWSVSSSLKNITELYIIPPPWLPKAPQWDNYVEVWRRAPFGRYLTNSLYVSVTSVIGAVLSSSIVGYSFARFRYHGRDLFFLITLSTMMLPIEVTLIPTYLMFNKIGWLDTYRPLIVPSWLGGGAFDIFLMRQFFMTIPMDLDESARIDGANFLQIYASILMPLSKPVLATASVLSFIGHWNDFLRPLIFLNTTDKFTVAVGLKRFQDSVQSSGEPTDNLLMAASITMAIPMIAIFFVAQRYFVQGVVMSGIKG